MDGSRDTMNEFVALDDVALTDVSLLSSEASARASVRNPFAFPLKIAQMTYTLFADGHEVGAGSTQGLILHPAQKNMLTLPIDVDHAALLSAAGGAVVSGGDVAVKLTGRLGRPVEGGRRGDSDRALRQPFGQVMSGPGYESLRLERQGPVARVVLARPAVRNAFDDGLIAELTRAFGEARVGPGGARRRPVRGRPLLLRRRGRDLDA